MCVCVVLVLFAPALCAPFFNEENWKQKFFPKKKFKGEDTYYIYKYTHARAHVRKGVLGVRSALLWLFSSSFSFSASSSGRARVGEREREREREREVKLGDLLLLLSVIHINTDKREASPRDDGESGG